LTRTYNKNQKLARRKSEDCVEKLEALERLGLTDPIEYG
jgi:hypothetical protein